MFSIGELEDAGKRERGPPSPRKSTRGSSNGLSVVEIRLFAEIRSRSSSPAPTKRDSPTNRHNTTDRGQQQRTNGELGTYPSRRIPPANRCQYPRPNHQPSMATSALAGLFKQFRHHRLDLCNRRKESVGSGVEQLAAQREVFLLLPAGEKAVVPDALKPRRQRMQ